jgi:CheY-like chemotaxis protein
MRVTIIMEMVRTPKIKILVVDDDDAVCQMLTLMLSDELYLVETTKSVAEALGAIEQHAFDGYVMDFKLPDGGGLDVAERIRSKGSKAPIIIISGYDPSAVELGAERFDISSCLQKPFSRSTFCSAVKKAIG